MTRDGREVADAIWSMSSVEVLEARMVSGLRHLVQLGESFLLERHLLEDRFDDDVRLLEAIVVEGRLNPSEVLIHLLLSHPAAFDALSVILLDGFQATIELLLADLLQDHRNAGVRVGHGDAAAHRARTDDGSFLYGDRGRLLADAGHARDGSISKENVDQRLGLI